MKKNKQAVNLTTPKTDFEKALSLLRDKNFKVAIQIAPAVRVALGEEFGMKMGSFVAGKMVTACKMVGFDYVYDVGVGADFTILEESNELVERIEKNINLPLFNSCCPIWMRYLESNYPKYLKNASTCKSPTETLSLLIKYYNPNVKVISVTPCIGKKQECSRDNNIDVSLTTKELAGLIKAQNIDFKNLTDSPFDDLFGSSSTAGLIFGVTGGVTEAILRSTVHLLDGKNSQVEFKDIRNNNAIREIQVKTKELTLNVAVVNGIMNAKPLMEELESGKKYHFVEFEACHGGCVTGPGQPYVNRKEISPDTIVELRGSALYEKDEASKMKCSHENPQVEAVYDQIGKSKIRTMLHLKRDEFMK